MSMTADLRDHYQAANVASGRVYRDERTEGDPLPGVVIQSITDPRTALMKGEDALRETQLQVDVWASSRGEADAIAETIIAARPLRSVVGVTNFRRIYVDDATTSSERSTDQLATNFRTRLDLTVWWKPVS